jgi:hypothetical protein
VHQEISAAFSAFSSTPDCQVGTTMEKLLNMMRAQFGSSKTLETQVDSTEPGNALHFDDLPLELRTLSRFGCVPALCLSHTTKDV